MLALRLAMAHESGFLEAESIGSTFSAPPAWQEGFLQGGPWVFSCVGIRYEAPGKFSRGVIGQTGPFGGIRSFFCNRSGAERQRQQKQEQNPGITE